MRVYIIRRLLLIIPTVLITSLIVFSMIRLIPGSIVDIMVEQFGAYAKMNRADVESELGLNVPIVIQYGRWIGVVPQANGKISGVLEGNLGDSLWHGTPVIDEIESSWPVTLELAILGLIIGQAIALPIGIYSSIRQDTWGDYITRSFAIFCIAVPGFWIGTMVMVFPSIWWGYTPPIALISFVANPIGNLKMFIIPAIVLGMSMAGISMRMTRTMMLEVLRQDYIRTAWAKGLKERVVVMRHALRNALIPVITIIGMQMPVLVGGEVIIENIFNLPGMGRLITTATLNRDYSIVSGTMLLFGVVMVLINLLVDLTYGYLDPRIIYK
ncbi:MAG: ABC transporter permease [Dehalococcoidales bacterium]